MLRRFDGYILREILPPFFIGLLVYSFVLLMNQIFLFAELIISRGVQVEVAGKLFLYLIPAILAFTIPMAVAMGVLAAMSRLSSDWEIMAMKTLGISLGRLSRPAFLFAFLAWIATSGFTLYLAPYYNDRWVQVLTESVLARAQFQVNPREFNETIPQTTIFILDVDAENFWSKVFVYQVAEDQIKIILAQRGRLNTFPELKRATLELNSGEVHTIPVQEPERHSVASFERHVEEVDIASLFPEFSRKKRVREKNIRELFRDANGLEQELLSLENQLTAEKSKELRKDSPEVFRLLQEKERKTRERRSHAVEIHKRFSLPFVCFVFVLIGLPLGISTRRGGRTSGFTLSLLVILVYYILITGGEKAALEDRLSPFAGMWGPNLIFLAVGLLLFIREAREERLKFNPGQSIFSGEVHLLILGARAVQRRNLRPSFFILGLREKFTRWWHRRKTRVRGVSRRKPERRRLFFPATLDRYLIRRFSFIYGLVFTALLFISVIVTIFERLDNIYEHNKPLGLLLRYVGFRLPEFIIFILPLTTLTTTLLTLGLMEKSNEVTAIKASGVSLFRLTAPILILALLASGLSFYLQENVVPYANKRAEEIWDRINDVPPRHFSTLNRRWVLGRDGQTIYRFSYFDPVAEVFQGFSVMEIDAPTWELKEIALAEKASLVKGQMILLNGWRREFQAERVSRFLQFREMARPSAEGADYFVKEWKEPSWMNFRELREYINEVSAMGFETQRLRVDLFSKLSFPLVSFIMTLLGLPFAFAMGRRGTLVGVGLSIAVAIIFWSAIGFMKNLGYIGVLPVFLAAWGPELLFGSLGLFLLSRLRT